MEHSGDADPSTEMAGIGSDRQHRLGRRVEKQVVDRGLVVECDVGDLSRQGEDDVEVSDRQQVGLALGQPGARGGALTLWGVPVAAAVDTVDTTSIPGQWTELMRLQPLAA